MEQSNAKPGSPMNTTYLAHCLVLRQMPIKIGISRAGSLGPRRRRGTCFMKSKWPRPVAFVERIEVNDVELANVNKPGCISVGV